MKLVSYALVSSLVFWPFHNHSSKPKPTLPSVQSGITIETSTDPVDLIVDSDCEYFQSTWYFMGPDGLVATSTVSCRAAARAWTHISAPRPSSQI